MQLSQHTTFADFSPNIAIIDSEFDNYELSNGLDSVLHEEQMGASGSETEIKIEY